jgi:hypothetical protein
MDHETAAGCVSTTTARSRKTTLSTVVTPALKTGAPTDSKLDAMRYRWLSNSRKEKRARLKIGNGLVAGMAVGWSAKKELFPQPLPCKEVEVRLRRSVTAFAVRLVPGLARAQIKPTLTIAPTQGPPGTQVTLTGTGWDPSLFPAPIQFREEADRHLLYSADLGVVPSSATVCANDSDGITSCNFTVQATVPSDAPAGVGGTFLWGLFPVVESVVVGPSDATDDGPLQAQFNVTVPVTMPPTAANNSTNDDPVSRLWA